MKIIPNSRKNRYIMGGFILLAAIALITAIVSCVICYPIEIRDWYDLDTVSDNLRCNYILMNNLDSTTAGYDELASPIANGGKGWEPIGFFGEYFPPGCGFVAAAAPWWYGLRGTFDGQGYEIRDLFINRPRACHMSPVGLFGSVGKGGIITNVGVVNITVVGCETVGGLAGWNYYGTLSNSYSTGNVTGNSGVGGLVGFNYWGSVSDSYSKSNVTGNVNVGGLVGLNWGTVSNSYSTGNVSGNSGVGGLVGLNEFDATVRTSFWDTETSRQATSDGGTGETTAEMQDIVTFSGAMWDITAVANPSMFNPSYIWNIVNGLTSPFLSWQS